MSHKSKLVLDKEDNQGKVTGIWIPDPSVPESVLYYYL